MGCLIYVQEVQVRSESATHQNHVELLLPVLVKYNIMAGDLKRNVSYATKISWSKEGCPSKLVSIQNNRNWNRN
jgi:hypothetical protein